MALWKVWVAHVSLCIIAILCVTPYWEGVHGLAFDLLNLALGLIFTVAYVVWGYFCGNTKYPVWKSVLYSSTVSIVLLLLLLFEQSQLFMIVCMPTVPIGVFMQSALQWRSPGVMMFVIVAEALIPSVSMTAGYFIKHFKLKAE